LRYSAQHTLADVAIDTTTSAYRVRREMEPLFAAPPLKTA